MGETGLNNSDHHEISNHRIFCFLWFSQKLYLLLPREYLYRNKQKLIFFSNLCSL